MTLISPKTGEVSEVSIVSALNTFNSIIELLTMLYALRYDDETIQKLQQAVLSFMIDQIADLAKLKHDEVARTIVYDVLEEKIFKKTGTD